MNSKSWKTFVAILVAATLMLSACATKTSEPEAAAEESEKFIFGLLMVGAYNDQGWSQAHYDAGLYVQENVPGTEMVYIDKVNTADRPGTTPAQLAEELVAKGAKLIIFNSDDMKDRRSRIRSGTPRNHCHPRL